MSREKADKRPDAEAHNVGESAAQMTPPPKVAVKKVASAAADCEDTLIRRAAEWAQPQLGLSFARLRKDGHFSTGLQSAYRRRKGTVT